MKTKRTIRSIRLRDAARRLLAELLVECEPTVDDLNIRVSAEELRRLHAALDAPPQMADGYEHLFKDEDAMEYVYSLLGAG